MVQIPKTHLVRTLTFASLIVGHLYNVFSITAIFTFLSRILPFVFTNAEPDLPPDTSHLIHLARDII
jgi:hypothetical protein